MTPPTSLQIHSSFSASVLAVLLILILLSDSEHPLLDLVLFDLAWHLLPPYPDEMAIDGEKRTRGLRVPSLASIKAFSKKGDSQQQQQQQQQQQTMLDHDKNLPSPPGFDTVSPPGGGGSSLGAMPAKRAPQTFGFDAVPMMDFESSRYPMPGPSGPPASAPAPAPGPPVSAPAPRLAPPAPQRPYDDGLAVPPVQRTSSNGSRTDDSEDPLEDYIPDPSPETETETDEMLYQAQAGSGSGFAEDGEMDNDDWEPPMADVPAPLGKLHFACYQDHRSMPSSANVWHAVPCMTCLKQDREIRHRCVFCCLRICEGCFGTLQKCSRRSLDELLAVIR